MSRKPGAYNVLNVIGTDENGRIRFETEEGYRVILYPEHPQAHPSFGTVFEHRMVVHDAGFELTSDHVIHHLNRDRADNRLENLWVMTRATHGKLHAK